MDNETKKQVREIERLLFLLIDKLSDEEKLQLIQDVKGLLGS